MKENDQVSDLTTQLTTKPMFRRQALQILGIGAAAAAGSVVLSACTKPAGDAPAEGGMAAQKPEGGMAAAKAEGAPAAAQAAAPGGQAAAGGSCSDKVPLDDAAKSLRKTLQYVDKGADATKKCSGCAQYIAGKYGDCGGCKLLAGGISPEGYCLSYAPAAAAPAAKPGKPG